MRKRLEKCPVHTFALQSATGCNDNSKCMRLICGSGRCKVPKPKVITRYCPGLLSKQMTAYCVVCFGLPEASAWPKHPVAVEALTLTDAKVIKIFFLRIVD